MLLLLNQKKLSLYELLNLDSVWPQHLVDNSIVDNTGQVSDGRQRPTVRSTSVQIWIQREATRTKGRGAQQVTEHPFLLHIMGGKGTKSPTGQQIAEVETLMESLVDLYTGALPFVATNSDIVGCMAQEGSVDVFASEAFVTGTVRVTYIVRG